MTTALTTLTIQARMTAGSPRKDLRVQVQGARHIQDAAQPQSNRRRRPPHGGSEQIFAARIEAAELSVSRLPGYTDFSIRIAALNPSQGARLLPINQAFQHAATQLGLWL